MLGLALCLIGCSKSESDKSAPIIEETIIDSNSAPESVPKSTLVAPSFMSASSKAHYVVRVNEMERQPVLSGGVVFIGDDLTENAHWGALFPEANIRNHGVGGDTTAGLEKRLSLLNRHSPEQIYLMIGENDGQYGRTSKEVSDSVSRIILLLHAGHPTAQIYLQSPIPSNLNALAWNSDLSAAFEHLVTRPEIKATGVEYIDILSAYISDSGTLKPDLYDPNLSDNDVDNDIQFGSHGYAVWASVLSRNVTKTIR